MIIVYMIYNILNIIYYILCVLYYILYVICYVLYIILHIICSILYSICYVLHVIYHILSIVYYIIFNKIVNSKLWTIAYWLLKASDQWQLNDMLNSISCRFIIKQNKNNLLQQYKHNKRLHTFEPSFRELTFTSCGKN